MATRRKVIIMVIEKGSWFYEKRFFRKDGEVYAKRYTRSFPIGKEVPHYDSPVGSNVKESSVSRAKSVVRQIAFANPQLVGLLTLTNKDCPSEAEAQRRFDLFRRKVARSHKGWQFLGVKELQDRGSIHWHLIVNFCPAQIVSPNNKLRFNCDLWDYGFSDYSLIVGDDKWRTELYLLKYLSKGSQKLFNSYYVRSRGLNVIDPRLYDSFEPIHPLAENVFLTQISNDFVDRFEILEYTYRVTTTKQGVKTWR